MAGLSRHLGAEGQHRQQPEPGRLALSTANLYSAVQPGGSLFGLQESNPVNTDAAYGGNADDYGTTSDFMSASGSAG